MTTDIKEAASVRFWYCLRPADLELQLMIIFTINQSNDYFLEELFACIKENKKTVKDAMSITTF